MLTVIRFGIVCGVLCGGLIAIGGGVEGFTGETVPTSLLLGLSPALAPALLVALYLGQFSQSGGFGAVAFGANFIGLGLFGGAAFTLNMALFYLDQDVLVELLRGPTRTALLGSAVLFAIGSALFGVAMFRARVYPRIPVVGYGVVLPAFALLAPLPDTVFTSALHVVAGGCLIWLALSLGSRMKAVDVTPPVRMARAS
jgi:hypothetical protein